MNETILYYINSEFVSEPDLEVGIEDDLLGTGILDSISMMKLVTFIEKEFETKVQPSELTVENFMTIKHITDFLTSR